MLIEGQHFAHTGVYGLFDYSLEEMGSRDNFPIHISGQPNPKKPCYQMTSVMDLIFTFHPVNQTKNSSFTYAPKDFVWKYELQVTTEDTNSEGELLFAMKLCEFRKLIYLYTFQVTVHGYFNLHAKVKTRLDLSGKYDKEKVKYIRFTCFEPCSPQHRAWFIPIRGLAFGKPRHLFPRGQGNSRLVCSYST